MSRKDNRPRSAFSLLYLATHVLDVSLNSATAVAMLGSFLSMLIVFLTLLITSCVSFVYSSSEAANAAGITRSGDERTVTAVSDKKLRRLVVVVVAALVAEGCVCVDCLQLMGSKRGLGVEVVGVIIVGDAMVVMVEKIVGK